MQTVIRAIVMTATLVAIGWGLLHFGPIDSIQPVAGRIVEFADQFLGSSDPAAPSLQPVSVVPTNVTARAGNVDPPPLLLDTPAPDGAAETTAQEAQVPGSPGNAEIQHLMGQLTTIGASEHSLRPWGNGGQLHRFCCAVPVQGDSNHVRHFEAVAENPTDAVEQVVAEVLAWRAMRNGNGRVY